MRAKTIDPLRPGRGIVVRGQTLEPREVRVLKCMCSGKLTKEIAVELGLTVRTVETYRFRLKKKTGARNATQLGVWAQRQGLITSGGA